MVTRARMVAVPVLTAVMLTAAPGLAIGGVDAVAAAAVQDVQPQAPGTPVTQTGVVIDHHRGGDQDRHDHRRHECRRRGGLLGLLARVLFGAPRHC